MNFVYTITKPMDTVQEDTFTTAEQAQNYINSHAVTYENYYNSETNGYQLKDSNGNVTDILTEYKSICKIQTVLISCHQSNIKNNLFYKWHYPGS